MTATFCASCTRDIAADAPRFDLDGATICARCESEHPREGGYSFDDGAKPTGGSGLLIHTNTNKAGGS